MIHIEPCCTSKTVPALLNRLGSTGTELWHGCADLTLADLLTPIFAGYNGGMDVMLVIPCMHRFLADAFRSLIGQKCISTLYILTDVRGAGDHPEINLVRLFPNNVILASHVIADTLLLLPDIAWWGNLGRGEHIGITTRDPLTIDSLRRSWIELITRYRIS